MNRGYLELEVADLKLTGAYRIVVVDHDVVSIKNMKIGSQVLPGDWEPVEEDLEPVVVITNPKNGQYLMMEREPWWRIDTSTHIRVLVWSNHEIVETEVEFDGVKVGSLVYSGKGKRGEPGWVPLWTREWDASATHIKVRVKDTLGRWAEDEVSRTIRPLTSWVIANSLDSLVVIVSNHSSNGYSGFYTLR